MAGKSIKHPLRVLHLEDNENDQILVREMLRAEGLSCEFVAVKTRDDFEAALQSGAYDIIISDFTLPSFDGLSALSTARELSPQTPFIFFSGTIGEEVAVESLKNGAADYVLKQRPSRLAPAVRHALQNARESARLQHAEGALQQSEERFRIVARATNDVIWEWDIPNNKLWFSETFQNVFGYSPDKAAVNLQHWQDLIHPDDRQRVVSGITAVLAGGGKAWWSEHRIRRADGSYAEIFDRASVIYDSKSRPSRMVGVSIDVTERKHAGEKIREQAELLRQARDAIILCDLELRIIFWNQGAGRIYGWDAGEAVGKNLPQLLFHGNPPPQIQEAIQNLDQNGEWSGELQEFTKDGKTVIVQGRATLIRDGQGRPKSILIINTDITERKQLEEKFLRSQRLESLGVLVSGIAHDLRNTLVPIVVGVEILRTQKLSEDAASMLHTMETSARRSSDMIKQMLTFARGGEACKTRVDVDHLVMEMSKIIADTFPKSIQCKVRLDKNPPAIYGQSTQLYQVLMNLCVNARDAMPDGGTLVLATGNVQISAAEAARHDVKPGNYLCISAADTGAGIPAAQMEKIFQPFFTTKPPGKGTGLGLSTSLGIVKGHGGFMTVTSKAGRGTEFKFFLPAATGTSAEISREPPPVPVGNGERILVVDDEEGVLAIMRAALENYGYSVLTAAAGTEAVACFAGNSDAIHLVITDLDMPLMDGRATIVALRKIRPDIKIIIASGSEKEVRNFPHHLKTEAFLPKPFTTESLLKTVHETLARK